MGDKVDLQDHEGKQDLLAQLVQLDLLDPEDHLDKEVKMVLQVHLAEMEKLVLLGLLVHQDQVDLLVLRVNAVHKDLEVKLALEAQQVSLDHQDKEVNLDQMD